MVGQISVWANGLDRGVVDFFLEKGALTSHVDTTLEVSDDAWGPRGALMRPAAAQVGRGGPSRAARVGFDTTHALGGRDAPRVGGTGKATRGPPTPVARFRRRKK